MNKFILIISLLLSVPMYAKTKFHFGQEVRVKHDAEGCDDFYYTCGRIGFIYSIQTDTACGPEAYVLIFKVKKLEKTYKARFCAKYLEIPK